MDQHISNTDGGHVVFQDALAPRLAEMLRRTAAAEIPERQARTEHRVTTAAAVVRELGMPSRHQAARAALSSAAGVYDLRFRPDGQLRATPLTDATLIWDTPAGVVADVCFYDPRLETCNPDTQSRVDAVRAWAVAADVTLSAIHIVPLARPMAAVSLAVATDAQAVAS